MTVDEDKTYIIPMLNNEAVHRRVGLPLRQKDIKNHRLVKPVLVMDGGMVEFFDPYTGKPVGCCGINFWTTHAREVTVHEK